MTEQQKHAFRLYSTINGKISDLESAVRKQQTAFLESRQPNPPAGINDRLDECNCVAEATKYEIAQMLSELALMAVKCNQ